MYKTIEFINFFIAAVKLGKSNLNATDAVKHRGLKTK